MTDVVVVGSPSLSEALGDRARAGVDVRPAPEGWTLERMVQAGGRYDAVVAVAGEGGDEFRWAAKRLVDQGVPVVVISDPVSPWCQPGVPALTPPFDPDDAFAVLGVGDRPLLFAVEGVGRGAPPPERRGPADTWPRSGSAGEEAPAPITSAVGGDEVPGWLGDAAGPASDPAGPASDPWAADLGVGREPGPHPDLGVGPGFGVEQGPDVGWGRGVGLDDPVAAGLGQRPPAPWRPDPAFPAVEEPARRRRRPGRPQVLMWTCPKGGSGKTSLSLRYAAFLADALASRSMRVVWVDGNVQQADGARYLGADGRARGIADLAGGPEPGEDEVLAALTRPPETGRPMWAMFGPAIKAEADPRLVSPALYRRVLDVLRDHFDHIVVDTPVAEHHNRFFTDFVIPEADQVIVVVPPLLPVVRGVREWLDLQSRPVAAGGAALPAATVRIVLNMASPGSGCPTEAVRDAWLPRWTWAGEIPLDPGWTAATNNGTLIDARSSLAGGFADLVAATTGDRVGEERTGAPLGWFRHLLSRLAGGAGPASR